MKSSEAGVGCIEYYFKGMRMKSEPAKVENQIFDNSIIVTRLEDGQKNKFVNISGNWLLNTCTNQNSLLYGTRFTLSL